MKLYLRTGEGLPEADGKAKEQEALSNMDDYDKTCLESAL
ncbi:INTS14 isoform 12, partial [Pan troglodytes]